MEHAPPSDDRSYSCNLTEYTWCFTQSVDRNYHEKIILRDVVRYLRRRMVAPVETRALGGLHAQRLSRRYDDFGLPTEVNGWMSESEHD